MNNRRVLVMIFCFTTLVLLAACRGNKDGATPLARNSAGALTAEQFAVASNRTLSPQEFADKVDLDPYFTYESLYSGSSDSCMEEKMDTFTAVRKADNTFSLPIPDINVKDCFPDPEATMNEATVSVLYDNAIGKDASGNIVDLSGIPMGAPDIYLVQFTMKMRMHFNVTHVSSGRTMDVVETLVQHAITGFNDPCVNEGADGCRMERVEQVHSNFTAPLDYTDKTVLESHGLGVVSGAPYYAGGTMAFSLNDWSGTMTYDSDPFTAPTYTATNGVTTVNGTYTHLAPLLKARSLKSSVGRAMRLMTRRAALKTRRDDNISDF